MLETLFGRVFTKTIQNLHGLIIQSSPIRTGKTRHLNQPTIVQSHQFQFMIKGGNQLIALKKIILYAKSKGVRMVPYTSFFCFPIIILTKKSQPFFLTLIGQDRCYNPIGIQNFQIPDSSFSASSQMSVNTPPEAAKLYWKANRATDGAWCANSNDQV
jgi:hypothetical protein